MLMELCRLELDIRVFHQYLLKKIFCCPITFTRSLNQKNEGHFVTGVFKKTNYRRQPYELYIFDSNGFNDGKISTKMIDSSNYFDHCFKLGKEIEEDFSLKLKELNSIRNSIRNTIINDSLLLSNCKINLEKDDEVNNFIENMYSTNKPLEKIQEIIKKL